MSMLLTHNFAAQTALGELNKNTSQVGKMLAKIATGEKVTGAKDNAAAYAISERMREKIRTLEQDTQNVQNGASLLKVASGGVERIVDELRTIKELAISAANDTNTAEDRATIQKEIDQRLSDINDIATTTNFNGKYLIDGTLGHKQYNTQVDTIYLPYIASVITGYETKQITVGPPSYTIIYNTDGMASYIQDNDFDLASDFQGLTASTLRKTANSTTVVKSGTGVNCDFSFSSSYGLWNWKKAMEEVAAKSNATLSGKLITYSEMAVSMDFNLSDVENAYELHNQGFSILCGGCSQYVNIKFDYSKDNSESTYSTATINPSYNMEYRIGIKDLSSLNSDALSEAIFEGLRAAHTTSGSYTASDTYLVNSDGTQTPVSTYIDRNHDLRVGLNPYYDESNSSNGSKYVFLKQYSPSMNFISKGTVLTTAPNPNNLTGSVTVAVESPTTLTISTPIYGKQELVEEIPVYGTKETGNPLYIHHGTQSNQAVAILLNDMHTNALAGKIPNKTDAERLRSLKSSDSTEYYEFQNTLLKAAELTLDDISVGTIEKANIAVKVVEGALEYALDLATNLGAYQKRMDVAADNVVTMGENVRASESTIRDSDMARETTNYTKYNILSQSAQSMLAQANQKSSDVLSLLR